MGRKVFEQLPRLDLPELDGFVEASAGEQVGLCVEGAAENEVCVSSQHLDAFSFAFGVPQPQGAIVRRAAKVPGVGGPGDARDAHGVSFEDHFVRFSRTFRLLHASCFLCHALPVPNAQRAICRSARKPVHHQDQDGQPTAPHFPSPPCVPFSRPSRRTSSRLARTSPWKPPVRALPSRHEARNATSPCLRNAPRMDRPPSSQNPTRKGKAKTEPALNRSNKCLGWSPAEKR
eukprot:scaffold587_cov339-Pavlova_lutheri.AAC.62